MSFALTTMFVPAPTAKSSPVSTSPAPPVKDVEATARGNEIAFCFALNILQSAELNLPVAEADEVGRLKVIVPVVLAMLKFVPDEEAKKVNVGPEAPLIVVVAPPPPEVGHEVMQESPTRQNVVAVAVSFIFIFVVEAPSSFQLNGFAFDPVNNFCAS